MNNLYDLNKIKEIYSEGKNIIEYLKNQSGNSQNDIEQILISYDFQAGTYIKNAKDNSKYIENYSSSIAKVMNQLEPFNSIMEVGVGEGTTLINLLPKIEADLNHILGFDVSWSRLRYAQEYSKQNNFNQVKYFTANLFNIPLADNSVEVVYTSHSIEPNGGKEEEALKELFRVTSKYLILLEPSYHFGSKEARERMLKNGYITNLKLTAEKLGYHIQEYRLFDYFSNILNPTELICIKKDSSESNFEFRCPITGDSLFDGKQEWYSENGLFVYPEISGIPCLLSDNGIIATKYSDFL